VEVAASAARTVWRARRGALRVGGIRVGELGEQREQAGLLSAPPPSRGAK
jgi:hypothetical protein